MNTKTKHSEKDEKLLSDIRKGSSPAFEELVHTHAEYFYQVAYRIVLSKEDAEDIVQEGFMKLLEGKAQWDKEKGASFRTWFYRIICNQAISHTRKKTHQPYQDTEYQDTGESPAATPEEELQNKESRTHIHQALKKLSVPQRIAIELFYYSGLPQKEAAKAMQVSQKAYESYLSRGRTTLRKELLEYVR